MIDASMIPDEVVEAARRAYYAERPCGFRESIAAALNAWETPMHRAIVGKALDEVGSMYPALILPLPKDAADE
jgi:hypothetical protein